MKIKLIIFVLSLNLIGCLCPGAHKKTGIYNVDIKEFQQAKLYEIYTKYRADIQDNNFYTQAVVSDVISNADTLGVEFIFKSLSEKIGMNPLKFSLVSTSYACSPNTDSYTLKNKIDSVLITSDTIYNGIEAGKSLNSYFFAPTQFPKTLQQLITESNQTGGVYNGNQFNFFIATNIKPGFRGKHKLFIKIYKSNSEVIEGATTNFEWY